MQVVAMPETPRSTSRRYGSVDPRRHDVVLALSRSRVIAGRKSSPDDGLAAAKLAKAYHPSSRRSNRRRQGARRGGSGSRRIDNLSTEG